MFMHGLALLMDNQRDVHDLSQCDLELQALDLQLSNHPLKKSNHNQTTTCVQKQLIFTPHHFADDHALGADDPQFLLLSCGASCTSIQVQSQR